MEKKYFLLILIFLLYVIFAYFFSRIGDNREIGNRRLFLISLILTPLFGLAVYLSSARRKIHFYTEKSYKCPVCGYVFSEYHAACPFCEKEGKHCELKEVEKFMT